MTNQTNRSAATLWLVSGVVVAVSAAGTVDALHVLVGRPDQVGLISLGALVAIPLGGVLGRLERLRAAAELVWRWSILVAGLKIPHCSCSASMNKLSKRPS